MAFSWNPLGHEGVWSWDGSVDDLGPDRTQWAHCGWCGHVHVRYLYPLFRVDAPAMPGLRAGSVCVQRFAQRGGDQFKPLPGVDRWAVDRELLAARAARQGDPVSRDACRSDADCWQVLRARAKMLAADVGTGWSPFPWAMPNSNRPGYEGDVPFPMTPREWAAFRGGAPGTVLDVVVVPAGIALRLFPLLPRLRAAADAARESGKEQSDPHWKALYDAVLPELHRGRRVAEFN